MKEVQLSVPNLHKDILPKIEECIESGWVSTGGRFIKEFEDKVVEFTGAGGARSTQSGTAGIHLALRVLGVEQGDEVIVPTLTFIAAVNPVKYLGAEPVFMDCDDGLNIDPTKIRQFIEEECDYDGKKVMNKSTNKQIKGIIVVHVFGNPANMEEIMDIAREFNLFVLEDATEALGSYYTEGRYAGKYCGTIGDMGVAKRIETGSIYVNNGEWDMDAPFGGYKQSGLGREGGEIGFEDLMEIKTIYH